MQRCVKIRSNRWRTFRDLRFWTNEHLHFYIDVPALSIIRMEELLCTEVTVMFMVMHAIAQAVSYRLPTMAALVRAPHLSSEAGTVVPDVPSGLSLTPPQETKKKLCLCWPDSSPRASSGHNPCLCHVQFLWKFKAFFRAKYKITCEINETYSERNVCKLSANIQIDCIFSKLCIWVSGLIHNSPVWSLWL
jgi:hypothetical protein